MIRKLLHKVTAYNGKLVDPVINIDCTEFEVNNWVLSDFIINKLVPVVGIRPFPLNELLLMCGALVRFKPEHLFEWGTHAGKSARIFYETGNAFNIPTIVHTIDLPPDVEHIEHPGREYARFIKHISKIKKYRGDGLETAIRLASEQPVGTRFMFFVDGDHSYESVHRELSGILEHFPTASILLHDTFYQSEKSGYNIGPYRAIQDIMMQALDKFVKIQSIGGLPGMTLLYRNHVV